MSDVWIPASTYVLDGAIVAIQSALRRETGEGRRAELESRLEQLIVARRSR